MVNALLLSWLSAMIFSIATIPVASAATDRPVVSRAVAAAEMPLLGPDCSAHANQIGPLSISFSSAIGNGDPCLLEITNTSDRDVNVTMHLYDCVDTSDCISAVYGNHARDVTVGMIPAGQSWSMYVHESVCTAENGRPIEERCPEHGKPISVQWHLKWFYVRSSKKTISTIDNQPIKVIRGAMQTPPPKHKRVQRLISSGPSWYSGAYADVASFLLSNVKGWVITGRSDGNVPPQLPEELPCQRDGPIFAAAQQAWAANAEAASGHPERSATHIAAMISNLRDAAQYCSDSAAMFSSSRCVTEFMPCGMLRRYAQ